MQQLSSNLFILYHAYYNEASWIDGQDRQPLTESLESAIENGKIAAFEPLV